MSSFCRLFNVLETPAFTCLFLWSVSGLLSVWALVTLALTLLWPNLAGIFLSTKTVDCVLTLRQLTNDGGQMIEQKGTNSSINIFVREFNLFCLCLADIVDLGAMKYVDIPLLVKQEYGHAKMHREGKKSLGIQNGKISDCPMVYRPFMAIFDLLILRMGKLCGSVNVLGFESCSGHAFYVFDKVLLLLGDDSLTDLTLFHFAEEVEHSGLTCQDLIAKSPMWCRVLALPVSFLLWFVFLGFPPIFHVLRDPLDCFQNPIKATIDLVKYEIALAATLLVVAVRLLQTAFLSSGLPLDSNTELEFCGRHFQKRILDRGISFRVVDRQGYPLLVRQ
jgi:hypothetical protein